MCIATLYGSVDVPGVIYYMNYFWAIPRRESFLGVFGSRIVDALERKSDDPGRCGVYNRIVWELKNV